MQTIPIDDVVVDDVRIRRHFDEDAILELTKSIQANGLIHAPTIRFDAAGKAILVAGERRLRALRIVLAAGHPLIYNGTVVPPGHIPYTTLADLPDWQVYTIELEENTVRKDISWQERVEAEAKLHELKRLANPSHTIADTAAIVHGANPTPSEIHQTKINVRLAEHLDDPDIRGAKDEREATKIARRKLENLFTEALAERIDNTASSHRLLEGSCLDLLDTLEPASVDCMVTDPPYGIDADTFTKQSGAVDGAEHHYDDSFEAADAVVTAIANAACMKPAAHIWMFCDNRRFNIWADRFRDAGWYVWPHPIIWDKCGVGALMGAANGPRHTYETILFAQRGGRPIRQVFADVLRVRAETDKQHAAQKPVDLFRQLIEFSCVPGDTVLDVCAGSGTIFPAATLTKTRAIGMEKEHESIAMCRVRLQSAE